MITIQDGAVLAAKEMLSLATNFNDMLDRVNSFLSNYDRHSYGGIIQNFPTGALNSDGSIGAADGSPVQTNPITLSGLYTSYGDFNAFVAMLRTYQAYCTNASVATDNRIVTIGKLIR